MAIKLEKGQRINLEKETGAKLTNFCVGCNWGAIIKKTFFGLSTSVVDVDLDLSCIMFDANGNVVDHIWSHTLSLILIKFAINVTQTLKESMIERCQLR